MTSPTPADFIRKFAGITALILGAVILIVVCIDPFFHYHRPWFGLRAVLTDKEYQCVGTLRHFEYDSLIAGSSVAENYNNAWFDEAFGGRTIKAVRSYGGTADLCRFLSIAYEKHPLRQVFYNIDPAALSAAPETTFAATGCPTYLYDRNPLNDFSYWFNKDVLFEKIPYMIARSLAGYDEGESYNWQEGKVFSEDAVLSHYKRPEKAAGILPEDHNRENLAANIALLTQMIEAHPETQFYFFFPPYSILWWDDISRNGQRDAVLWNELQTMKALLGHQNVRVYSFMAREDIVTDLDLYMDTLHFSPDINRKIAGWLKDGTGEIQNEKEAEEKIEELRRLTENIEERVTERWGETLER